MKTDKWLMAAVLILVTGLVVCVSISITRDEEIRKQRITEDMNNQMIRFRCPNCNRLLVTKRKFAVMYEDTTKPYSWWNEHPNAYMCKRCSEN